MHNARVTLKTLVDSHRATNRFMIVIIETHLQAVSVFSTAHKTVFGIRLLMCASCIHSVDILQIIEYLYHRTSDPVFVKCISENYAQLAQNLATSAAT